MGLTMWFIMTMMAMKTMKEKFLTTQCVIMTIFFTTWAFNKPMLFLSFDLLSISMTALTTFIMSLIFMTSSMNSMAGLATNMFNSTFAILMMFLIISFGVVNWMFLYLAFECCVIPTFFVILGWGMGSERLSASFYFMFYTIFFSMPFFFLLFYVNNNQSSMMMEFNSLNEFCNAWSMWAIPSMMIFLAKLPIFFFHIWLPKAHVEAPMAGSMILAGILLKLGGYGIIRMLTSFFLMMKSSLTTLYSLGIISSILSGLSCFRQVDLKRLVAFMSISHMSMILSGMMTLKETSLLGSILFMVGHGLVSSGLFGGVTYFYDRLSTRSIPLIKGGVPLFSSLSLFMFLMAIVNMSFPPSVNFISELFMIMNIMYMEPSSSASLMIIVMLGCITSMHLYVSVCHGTSMNTQPNEDLSAKMSLFFTLHCISPFLFVLIML